MNWIIQWFCRHWPRRKSENDPIIIDGEEFYVSPGNITAYHNGVGVTKTTIGDYTRDSDNLISSDWVNGDGPR